MLSDRSDVDVCDEAVGHHHHHQFIKRINEIKKTDDLMVKAEKLMNEINIDVKIY